MNHIVLFAASSEAKLKNYKPTKLQTYTLQEQEFNIKHMAVDTLLNVIQDNHQGNFTLVSYGDQQIFKKTGGCIRILKYFIVLHCSD